MNNIRVHALAKEINITSKELLDILKKNSISATSHMSSIEENDAKKIIKIFTSDKNNSKKLNIYKKNDYDNGVNANEIEKTNNNINNNNSIYHNKNKIDVNSYKKNNENIFKDLNNDINDNNKVIKINNNITVLELAEILGVSVSELIKKMISIGLMYDQNRIIDHEIANNIAKMFDTEIKLIKEHKTFDKEKKNNKKNKFNKNKKNIKEEKKIVERPPVVVVMGHVDHGKTLLLDTIRNTNVIETEAGGITQHIGAYTVNINNKLITFLDTPGHEAFTEMRMRGAQVTDVAVLVIAADDGVMPQTIEAINHAKSAGVEIIIAINKIDKNDANVDRVKKELSKYDLLSEDWGGKTICVPISAKKNIGIDNLLEMIILVAELKELKSIENTSASGIVIEAKLDRNRGIISTVLVQEGTLKISDPIVAGYSHGKIRAMFNDKGHRVKKATASTPVEILGLSSVPLAGDKFYVTDSDKQSKQITQSIKNKNKTSLIKHTVEKISLDNLLLHIQAGNMIVLNIIIKADVQGSLEALKNSLERLSNDNVKVKTIHAAVGAINASDINLASASNAIVIGFNVRPDTFTKSLADREKIDVRLYKIIYDAIEDIEKAMRGLLDPIYEEKVIGHVEIRKLFKVSSLGTIGGSHVIDGKITRNSKVRVLRNGKIIYTGELSSLKREKNDTKEVTSGFDCGLMIDKFNDIKELDIIEAYENVEIIIS
ncbi:MAG: translation initiation factor IF-2 [Clostridiales bacterium]|nr:translation initiation factor IF-2 [Clostridiales bacterium]